MAKNPYKAREAEKYHLPILSREYILKGTVIGHRDGFGFLRVEGQKNDFYLSLEEMRKALHGDVVLIQALCKDPVRRTEVRIIRVLVPRSNHIVGHYFLESGIGHVVPDDSRLSFDIFIPKEHINGARMGNVVVVEMITRPARHTQAVGNIVEVLGESIGINVAVDIALRNYEIPYIWPLQVEKQVADFSEQIPASAKKGRVNLCHLPLVTIDDEDARDFDDAVYCMSKEDGGWCLLVAIADVSYYVRPQTAVDNEAFSRGNSVYFPSRVIPMLPEIISNGLCSLNPEVERLCLVCEIQLSAEGQITSSKFYEAVMRSHARLTYTKVDKILQGDKELRQHYKDLVPHIEQLHRLYKSLDSARIKRGAICFESEEAKFIFNKEKRIEQIVPVERNDAHKLIEECMILANIAAAGFVERNKEPSLYRVHDRPKQDSIINLQTVFSEFGLTLPGGMKPQSADYAKIMDAVAERPDHELLQTMILRSMKQAIYDPENRGHFGLALKSYAHFTSPIRRYPDLALHRSIKYLLSSQHTNNQPRSTLTGGWHTDTHKMLQLGEHCSMTERRADEATRDVADWLKCDFMQDQVGNLFTGIITSVTGFGFFVRLKDLFIDGLVHVSSLNNDYYRYDNVGQRLIGESSGMVYRLGDEVEISVEAVHINERKINFTLISTLRKVKNLGKTEKAKKKIKNTISTHSKHSQNKKLDLNGASVKSNLMGTNNGADKRKKISLKLRAKKAIKKAQKKY
ncbi:Ribonuclease R [Arsenophonus endosymbiont of Aleurodicus dispersus]|uniref:ribonuclease R n=1 Tax=Arsenophonus endosymbiont of Aleurodicus dispersus TaxID=235559 RepID=UPI000EB272DB|nr:ribonuclease R [Arsenophonus endosymbiont of Aleurodicus dispersus]VAY02407.1 Ribonuclease R [Arsenophonus endosymbiont of Aleurodicus dispersus]